MKLRRKEVIEWVVILGVGATLYFTGLHTEVIGTLQRVVLATGIISPDTDEQTAIDASYNLVLEDFEGNTLSLSSFKGKTIFLNFWATWCPPCVAEMPDIHNLYEKVGDNTQFVMISLDEDRDKARAFIGRKDFKFPVYFLVSTLPSVYDPHSIPTTYVVSPEGKIVATQHGMAKYNSDDFIAFLKGLEGN